MNDFLKNLRTGKDKQSPQKKYPYDSHQYHYEKQYRGNEKRTGNERRKTKAPASDIRAQNALNDILIELLPFVKQCLTTITENQERLIYMEESRAKAEEKKAEAIAGLVEYLKSEGVEALIGSREIARKKKRIKKPIDANRKKVMQLIAKMRAKGETFEKIALQLDKEKFQTFSGRGQWHAQTIHRLYQDHILGEE